MGRASFIVDIAELTAEIAKLEATQTFNTRSELFETLSLTEWASKQKKSNGGVGKLSSAMAYLLCTKHNVPIRTPKGKKGIVAGGPVVRKPKVLDGNYVKTQMQIINSHGFPVAKVHKLKKLVDRAAKGNKSACIKLHCLGCMNFENTNLIGDAANCGTCELYSITKKE